MDIQNKIRLEAEQQRHYLDDLSNFVEKSVKTDEKAKKEAAEFDLTKLQLPAVRGAENILQDVQFLKERGNNLFKTKKFAEARDCYKEALGLQADNFNDELRSQLTFNISLCIEKLSPKDFQTRLSLLNDAIKLDEKYEKARVKRAKLHMDMEQFDLALEDFGKSNRDTYQQEIQVCVEKIQEKKLANAKKNVAIDFEEDDDTEQEKQVVVEAQPQKAVVEQKVVQQQKEKAQPSQDAHVNPIAPNPETLGDMGAVQFLKAEQVKKPFDFYMQLKQLVRYPPLLSRFCDQFHSAVLVGFLEELEEVLTYSEFEALLLSVIGEESVFTLKKRLNLCFSVAAIPRFDGFAEFFGDGLNAALQKLYAEAERQLRDDPVAIKRLNTLRSAW